MSRLRVSPSFLFCIIIVSTSIISIHIYLDIQKTPLKAGHLIHTVQILKNLITVKVTKALCSQSLKQINRLQCLHIL